MLQKDTSVDDGLLVLDYKGAKTIQQTHEIPSTISHHAKHDSYFIIDITENKLNSLLVIKDGIYIQACQ